VREVDLVIAGLGIRINHVTPETLDALQSSRVVFYVGKAPGVRELIESCCAEAVDLSTAYRENVDRFETYKFMAAVIVDAALSRSPVTFAEYGHPLVLAQPSVLAVRAATRLGLRTRVLPAVSALDCLFADLGIDPVQAGLQMHEATELLLYKRPLVPQMATIIWQVGTLETRLYTGGKKSLPERLVRFRDYLIGYYPPGHIVFSVASSTDPQSPPTIHRFRIDELPARSDLLHTGTTLYIPPASQPSIADDDLMSQLTSEAHLRTIVR
jgi:uncharacterized protein YabN with tetrapyrrole methylase and pyrophosphatase domain